MLVRCVISSAQVTNASPQHTDYGVLTILKQDSLGGLFVKNRVPEWIAAPPIPNSFVINIGDMLEKMTKGFYRYFYLINEYDN